MLLTRHTGELLLGKRINAKAAGLYSTPGGRIEEHENMFQAAVREVYEETGAIILVKDLRVIGWKEHFRFHMHYFLFYLHCGYHTGELQDKEPGKCLGWKWFPLRRLPENSTEPPEMIHALLSLCRCLHEPAWRASTYGCPIHGTWIRDEAQQTTR